MSYLIERITRVAAHQPEATIGGWAALALLGVGVDFIDGSDGHRDLPVDVIVPAHQGRRSIRGARLRCYGHEPPPSIQLGDLHVTAPERAVLDHARWQRREAETLAAIDIGLRHGLATKAQLTAIVRDMPRLHGVRRLRATLGWGSRLAASPKESVLRWHWLTLGLGWPLVNPAVYDLDGRLIGMPDLMDPLTGLCAEFQGMRFHASAAQRAADDERAERFRAAGLVSVPIWAPDLASGHVAAKLRDGASETGRFHRRWVVSPGDDVERFSVGLIASSDWGWPIPLTAPVERLAA